MQKQLIKLSIVLVIAKGRHSCTSWEVARGALMKHNKSLSHIDNLGFVKFLKTSFLPLCALLELFYSDAFFPYI